VYGRECTVIWEDGGNNPTSYPFLSSDNEHYK
jgi:hypothetical protein